MKKFLVLGRCEPFIVEAEDWESAFWKAWESLKENIASITVIPEEQMKADYEGLECMRVDLSKVNMSEADLYRTSLSVVNMSGADLYRASLSEVNMSGAKSIPYIPNAHENAHKD